MHRHHLYTVLFFVITVLLPFNRPSPVSAAGIGITDTIAPTTDLILPFGAIAVGESSLVHTVTIKNPDPVKKLTVPSLQITSSAFILDPNGGGTPCGTGTILSPQTSCTFTVTFKPATEGSHSALLSLSSGVGDEERIAFHDPATKGISLYGLTSNKVTTEVTHPTNGAIDLNPSWSPGQGQIVFHRQGTNPATDTILRVNLDGTGETLVANFGRTPAWSPKGDRIAFKGTAQGEIIQVDLNTNKILSMIGATGAGEGSDPHWSPDGQKLVFAWDGSGGTTGFREITTSDLNGNAKAFGPDGETPSWSTNQLIAFQANDTKGISTFDPVGILGLTTPLTIPSPSIDKNPSWKPDGTQIVFHRAITSPASDELRIVNATSKVVGLKLVSGKTPEWSPSSEVSISFLGTGLAANTNSPPSAPQLVSPTEGATNIDGASVEFKWLSSGDPDGDPITYDLLLCKSVDFPSGGSCFTKANVQSSQKPETAAGIWISGGALLFGIALSGRGRKKHLSRLLALIAMIVVLNACSSGGGNGTTTTTSSGTTGGVELTHTETGLAQGTAFTWQVTAKDNHGNATASVARTFTTAP